MAVMNAPQNAADPDVDVTARLERDLTDAHLLIACLVRMAGGSVTISEDVMTETERRRPTMQVEASTAGERTYTITVR